MANWTTLRPPILQRIVNIYSTGISFRKAIKESVYTCAIAILISKGILLSTSSPHAILYRTNIAHIVNSAHSQYARQGVPSTFSALADILETFGRCFCFDQSSSLQQTAGTRRPRSRRYQYGTINNLTPTLYGISPHVRHLSYISNSYPPKNQRPFPLGILLDFYLPQLTKLSLLHDTLPIFGHNSFSQHLTHLSLHIDSKSAERIPRIFAPSLIGLWLFYSDAVHSWDIFRDCLPGSVVFESLLTFRLFHRSSAFSLTKRKATYLSPLLFPKLKVLRLDHYPFNYSSSLAFFKDSPLQTVTIDDKVDRFRPLAILPFQHAQSLFINISMGRNTAYDSVVSKHFLASRTEIAIQTSLPMLLPRTIHWTGLEELAIQSPVNLADLVTILPQLPHLRWLLVGAIYGTGSSIENTEPAYIWSSTLTQLILFSSIVQTANNALSEHIYHRGSSEPRVEVVGYLPSRGRNYLLSGIPYTDSPLG
ncbi:hypothetical protein DL89DRAFT_265972 [Linderina pennispora]|uniref:F-box domain-containing protein n=1 Tax=Linderina pennispora TaxID=61395 RepID=A0A1Y1WH16_9FUNG|nr:uncharacterized protein DL89DRAFT_265972 [Linderina pennispora]ORX72414.1 hypothetical protein DL89DRAFT_265972 [Linderina pennispora]